MLLTKTVISSSCVGDNRYLPPLRSCSLKSCALSVNDAQGCATKHVWFGIGLTSELLLSSLPVFFHKTSDENVDNKSFAAPERYVSYTGTTGAVTIRQTKLEHVLIKQLFYFLLYTQTQR